MAAITKIEFWSDVGFIDGAVEIPRLDAADPTNPDVIIEEEILPSKDRFFSELKLKEYYTGLLTMSYVRVTYELKNSLGIDTLNVFYGWIDSVKLSSDGELPMTIISWHIDEWRTWKSAMTFGYGLVKRKPLPVNYPDRTPHQNIPYRFLDMKEKKSLIVPNHLGNYDVPVWWVIVIYNGWVDYDPQDPSKGGQKTSINYVSFPVRSDNLGKRVRWNSNPLTPWTQGSFISLEEILDGYLSESMGIAPERIVGAWLSPCAPFFAGWTPTFIEESGEVYLIGTPSVNGWDLNDPTTHPTVWYERTTTTNTSQKWDIAEFTPSEINPVFVQGLDGSVVHQLPYGITINAYQFRVIVTPTDCSLQIRFIPSDRNKVVDPSYTHSMGLAATISLVTLPVNENSWDSYVYSAQREYDEQMRIVQSNTNAWKSAAGGGASGAIGAAFGPAGLAVGMIGGTASGLIGYGVEMAYTNDETQKFEDILHSNQSPGMLLSGNGEDVVLNGQFPQLVTMEIDPYSKAVVTEAFSLNGVSCDELVGSTQSLVEEGGPMMIRNLIVGGNVPVSAKRWVREKFRSGVRLI